MQKNVQQKAVHTWRAIKNGANIFKFCFKLNQADHIFNVGENCPFDYQPVEFYLNEQIF